MNDIGDWIVAVLIAGVIFALMLGLGNIIVTWCEK